MVNNNNVNSYIFVRDKGEDNKEADEDKKENNFVLPWEMKYFSPMLRYSQLLIVSKGSRKKAYS